MGNPIRGRDLIDDMLALVPELPIALRDGISVLILGSERGPTLEAMASRFRTSRFRVDAGTSAVDLVVSVGESGGGEAIWPRIHAALEPGGWFLLLSRLEKRIASSRLIPAAERAGFALARLLAVPGFDDRTLLVARREGFR